jgi:hypothetical protein
MQFTLFNVAFLHKSRIHTALYHNLIKEINNPIIYCFKKQISWQIHVLQLDVDVFQFVDEKWISS